MNRDSRKGFVAGLLTAALALGVGAAALAVTRSISVDDGIRVTVNGVPFTPRDVNGGEVELFAYNGTTYAPIRAFAKAAGLSVDYDAETNTARIETPDYAARTDPQAADYIGEEKALALALADAGVKAEDALVLKSALDWDDGKAVYEVEFCAADAEYDYDLDARTGAVVKKELDLPDYDWPHRDGYRIEHKAPAASITEQKTQAVAVTEAQAKETALARVSGGTVVKCELDYEDDTGGYVYELELVAQGREYDCEIDAQTGAVLKFELDD